MPTPIQTELTHDSIREVLWVDRSNLSTYRAFAERAGEIERLVESDGSWTIIDQSDGNAQRTYTPPTALQDALVSRTVYVDDYRETPITGPQGRKQVTLTQTRDTHRTPDGGELSESASSEEWLFDWSTGAFATKFVTASDVGSGEDIRLQLSLLPEQAELVLENPTRLEAVSIEEIPDGPDLVRDTTSGNVNTVSITRPSSLSADYLEANGDYVVRDWTVTVAGPPRWLVRLTVRKV
jgi:hypothetical protein